MKNIVAESFSYLGDPIDGDAICRRKVLTYHSLNVGAIQIGSPEKDNIQV